MKKSFTDLLKLPLSLLLSLVICSCTKEPKSESRHQTESEVETAFVQEPQAAAHSSPSNAPTAFNLHLPPNPTRLLREVPIDEANKRALKDAMAKNPQCHAALEETKGMSDSKEVTDGDVRRIYEIATTNIGFIPSSWGGSVVRFAGFTEVIIFGGIDGKAFNVYLVRFPNRDWMQVTAKHVGGIDYESMGLMTNSQWSYARTNSSKRTNR